MINGNATPTYTPTPEQLDQFSAQAQQVAAARVEAARRSAEWPLHVEQILSALTERVQALETRLTSGAVQG